MKVGEGETSTFGCVGRCVYVKVNIFIFLCYLNGVSLVYSFNSVMIFLAKILHMLKFPGLCMMVLLCEITALSIHFLRFVFCSFFIMWVLSKSKLWPTVFLCIVSALEWSSILRDLLCS